MPNWLNPAAPMLPRLLRGAGYATAHFGKWHLGHGVGAPTPAEYGFDVSKVVNGSGPRLGEESGDPSFRAKSTALITDETIAFLRANRERPFFVNAWTLLPHAKLNPTAEQLSGYVGLQPRSDDPAFGGWMQKYLGQAKSLSDQMQVYCASLSDLDEQVGRLLNVLDELGLAEHLKKRLLAWSSGLPASGAREKLMPEGLGISDAAAAKKTDGRSGPKATAVVRAAAMKRWDTDQDGQLTLDEYRTGLKQPDAEQRFQRFDANGDGRLTREEFVGSAGGK